MGALWNHAGTAAKISQFDNFKLTVSTTPTVTTPTKSAIAVTTATLGATVSADGGAPIDDYGIVWATTVNPTTANTKIPFGTTVTPPSTFTVSATALTAGSVIHYRGYAHNSSGTSYSADDSFYTLSTEPSTHVGSFAAAAASSTSIGLSWTAATGATGYLILQRAGAVAPTGAPADATAYTVGGTVGDGTVAAIVTSGAAVSATINSLSSTSQYSYAIFPFAWDGANAATYNYYTAATVPMASATTQSAATPTISVALSSLSFPTTAVGGTSANLTNLVSGANLTANITITAPANFQISTAPGSGFGGTVTLTRSGGTVASTPVYVRFQPPAQGSYADNITNLSIADAVTNIVAVSGIGAAAPGVSTQPAASIITSSATFNGTVITNNNSAILDRGFYYNTSGGVSTSATQASEGGTAVGTYSKTVTGLGANQIYYYRAYASNVIGTTLDSADTSFYTLANTPVAPTVSSPTTNTLNVAIGSDGNPSGTAYLIQETNSGNYVQANGTLGVTAVYQPAATWGTTTVTNLSLGTAYVFQVQATNGAGVATAFGPAKSASTANLPFTPGNLVVYRVGDGGTALSGAGAPIFLDEYNVGGTRIQSFPLPTTSSGPVNALVAAGNSSSEGLMTRSVDGRYLMFTGYKAAVGAANVGSSASSTTPRTVARVDVAGSMDTSTALTDLSSTSNPRSVASVDGTAFWAGGGAGGVRYAALGATTSTQIESPAFANTRQFNIFSNQLYLSTATSTNRLATVGTGTPTTSGQAVVNLPGFPTSGGSPYGFFFCTLNGGAGLDTVYVADDGGSAGIQKYCLDSGSWALKGTITAANVRGLTASVSGTTVTLYGSTSGSGSTNGSIYTVTDTAGYDAAPSTTTATVIATAANNMAFRGVAFAPKSGQTITAIAATAAKNYGDSPYSVATTASSGLTVAYASDNPSVATVDASGNVTIIGTGIAHLTASQPGNATYAAATFVTQTLTVSPLAASVTADVKGKNYGDANPPLTATVVGTINGDMLNYTLATDAAQFSGVGTSNITVTLGSNPNYSVLTTNSTLIISPLAASVTADPKSKNYGDANPSLTATVVGTINGDTLNYTLATDATQFSAVGTSNIVVTLGSNPNYSVLTTNSTLTINSATLVTPTFNLVSSANPSGYHGSVTFTANTILPADVTGTIQFTTNGANLGSAVAISGGSAVSPSTTGLPRGTTNAIQAIYSGDANYLSITNTLTQTVTNHPPAANANTYYRNGLNNWKIATSDLLTNTSDADGDTLTLTVLGVSTNLVTLDTNSAPGYAQYANLNHVDDRFTYTVADAFGGTNTATITLAFSLTGDLTGTNSIAQIVPGNPTTITANGVINFTYISQRSTNIANPAAWVNLQTNTAAGGVITTIDAFSDLGGTAPAQAYYRLQWSN